MGLVAGLVGVPLCPHFLSLSCDAGTHLYPSLEFSISRYTLNVAKLHCPPDHGFIQRSTRLGLISGTREILRHMYVLLIIIAKKLSFTALIAYSS